MPSATTAAIMGSLRCVRHLERWSAAAAALTTRARSRQRLASPHERADELAVDGGDGVGTEPRAGENVTRALGRVDTRRLHVDVFEPGLREFAAVLALLERPGDASDPELDAAADLGRHLPAHDHVRHGE